MKKLLLIAVMSIAASSAMASVKLLVRSDYMNTPNYSDSSGATIGGDSVFVPTVARLYLTGSVGDAVIDSGFNLRAFVPTVANAGTATDLTKSMTPDSFVEHLTIAKSYGDWTFTAGKLYMNVGGFERRKMFDGSSYFTALAVGQTAGSSLAGTSPRGSAASFYPAVGSSVTPDNQSGIAAAYNITPDQKLEVQLTNQTNSQSINDGNASVDKRNSYGLSYNGTFLNKMIQVLASYNIGAADTTPAGTTPTALVGGQEETFWNAGVRLLPMENLTVDLEYLSNNDKYSATASSSSTSSAIIEARYAIGMWTPVLKYENSKDKFLGTEDFDRNAFSVAVELKPNATDAFSYHAAWVNTADSYKGVTNGNGTNGSNKVTDNTILVGFTYTGDIVK